MGNRRSFTRSDLRRRGEVRCLPGARPHDRNVLIERSAGPVSPHPARLLRRQRTSHPVCGSAVFTRIRAKFGVTLITDRMHF